MSYKAKAAKALEDGSARRVSRALLSTGKYEVTVVDAEGRRVGTGDTDEAALDAALAAEPTAEPVDAGEATPEPEAKAAHAHGARKASADK